jgi:glucose-1-phosphatase
MQDDRILVFDLGGVLVESSGHLWLSKFLPHLGSERIAVKWLDSQSVRQFERGMITRELFAQSFVVEWQLRLEPLEFLEAFASWVTGFPPGAEGLIRNLSTRYTVGCLSNTNETHWEKLNDVRTTFDVCMVSHLIGHMKPDREIYEHALQRHGVAPSKVYFFDDLAPNIAAARNIGINAFQVRGLTETKRALRDIGIAVDSPT